MYNRLGFYSVLLLGYFLYSASIYTIGTELPSSLTENQTLVLKGKSIYQKHNCAACHQLYGLGGHMGPDLTNVLSKPGKGEPYARAILKAGLWPMPNFNLSDQDIDHLIAFFRHVDSTGESPPRNYRITPWGSIQVKDGKNSEVKG